MIEAFCRHLGSAYEDILENTLWFLCNIVQESYECRDKIIISKIFGEVMKILRRDENTSPIIENSIWFLSCLMKLTNTTPPKIKAMECLELFAGYLYTQEQKILVHCCWGLYNLSKFDEKIANINYEILKSGAAVKLMKLRYAKYQLCICPAVRVLGNLCAGEFHIVDVYRYFLFLLYS
jgi:hypothetical protein